MLLFSLPCIFSFSSHFLPGKRRVKVLAQLIETVLGHGRAAGKSAFVAEMLAALMPIRLENAAKDVLFLW